MSFKECIKKLNEEMIQHLKQDQTDSLPQVTFSWDNILNILFNNRRKKESRSPMQMYNILSIKIGLSVSTLASFYRHQEELSMDKIIELVEKEGNKKSVSFSNSSSSNDSSSSVRGSNSGSNIAK